MSALRQILAWLAITFALSAVARAQEADADASAFFETNIRPLLAENCFSCHGPNKQEGGLRLDSRSSMLAGGESGPAVIEGRPEDSLLVEAVNYRSLEMPPTNRLSDQQVALLTQWIKRGVPWPKSDESVFQPRPADKEITDDDRHHWSFLPRSHPRPPNHAESSWDDTNPIDGFVLAKLTERNLAPSAPATKRELLRRAYFDLIGLPPTSEQVTRFLNDDSPTAFERVIDELLASPQYGERWGRHWLDLVRFAQTNGYERDGEKPYVWRYRDYVIRAFNEDKPYDRFVLEQLAGDELADVSRDSIIATGYYHLGVWDDEPDDKEAAIYAGLDDVLRTTGETFLGLTIGCARCHDHKFDPIPQADYYRLLSLIRNISPYGKDKSATHWQLNPDAVFTPLGTAEQIAAWLPQRAALQASLDELRDESKDSAEEKEQKKKKRVELEKQLDTPPYEQALSVREPGQDVPATRILVRGNHLTPGAEVAPAFLTVLGSTAPVIAPLTAESVASGSMRDVLRQAGVTGTSGRRRTLAEWIANPANPLTARVIVNRIWQHHFGRGIVATPNDFGRTGRAPTHPELLDWLANSLIENGWQMKPLHRMIMLSQAYQQSSHDGRPAPEADPDNALLWRQNLHRLEGETLRDAMLATSGTLNLEMSGRGIFPQLSAEVLASQSRPGDGWDKSDAQQRSRRSVYVYLKRTLGVPMLEAFDAPVLDAPEPSRQSTTIAPQSLILLNSDFVQEQATAFAARVVRERSGPIENWIDQAYQDALCRTPTASETATMQKFFERRRAELLAASPAAADVDQQACMQCCRLIFNLNEFLYVD